MIDCGFESAGYTKNSHLGEDKVFDMKVSCPGVAFSS